MDFVGKVMSLLFNMLSRLVITFLTARGDLKHSTGKNMTVICFHHIDITNNVYLEKS